MAGKLKSGALVTDISVSAYNDMLDMLRWWRLFMRTGSGSGPRGDYNRGVFNGRNDVEFPLDIFSVVGINGPLIAPTYNEQEFKNKASLKLTVPEAPAHDNKFAVTLEPCPAGSICKVCVCGMVPVLLDVVNESDEFATIDDGATSNLITGGSGVPIIWKDAEGGENLAGLRWGLVLLGQVSQGYDRITGLTTAAVETTDETFEIYNISVVNGADPREDTSSTAETVTIVNTPGWKMADDQRIFAHWDERLNSGDGGWEVYLVYSTVTVVTDVTISGGKLKKKTKTIGVFYAGTESAWSAGTDVFESADWDEFTIVKDVDVSGTSLRKSTITAKLYNPDGNTATSLTSYHDGTTCE